MKSKNICNWYNVCSMKRYFKEGKLNIKWVNEYCWGNYQHCIRRKMEEKGENLILKICFLTELLIKNYRYKSKGNILCTIHMQ